jgi:hypothetical protein
VRIRKETLEKMTFAEAAEFLGERLLLLIPRMRDQYAKEIERMGNQDG